MQTDQEAGPRHGAALCSSAQPDGGQSLFRGQRGAIENVSAQQKHDPVVALKCSEESQKPAEGSAGGHGHYLWVSVTLSLSQIPGNAHRSRTLSSSLPVQSDPSIQAHA